MLQCHAVLRDGLNEIRLVLERDDKTVEGVLEERCLTGVGRNQHLVVHGNVEARAKLFEIPGGP